jgi:hypothetical protein
MCFCAGLNNYRNVRRGPFAGFLLSESPYWDISEFPPVEATDRCLTKKGENLNLPKHSGRRAKRLDFVHQTTIRYGAFREAPIFIHDISFTGLLGRCSVVLPVGGLVSVALPGIGLVRSQITRRRGDIIGIEFQKPIDIRKCFPERD